MTTPYVTVQRICELATAGHLSQAAIARMVGLTPETVRNILRHPRSDPWGGIVPPDMDAPPEFCPGCRAMVQMPCLACQLRQRREHQGRRAFAEA